MENKHFISWSLENVNLNDVPDDVLMSHIRILAHKLDKEIQRSHNAPVQMSENTLSLLTSRLEAANKRFTNKKPDLEWANSIYELYRKTFLNNFSIPCIPKEKFEINECDFNKLLMSRRSIRNFTNEPISNDLLRKIINYGLWAPSNCNVQAVRYILAKSSKARSGLEINGFTKNMGYCTLAVIADYRFYPDGDIDSPIHDCASAIQNILLACRYYGIGACYISDKGVNTHNRRKALGIKNDFEKVTAFIWMGQYDKEPVAPNRRKLEEVLEFI